MSFLDNFNIKKFLIDGLVISSVFTCFVYLTLYLNPWLWLEDYPDDVREIIMSPPDYQIQKIVIGVMGITIIVVMTVRSTLRWANNHLSDIRFIHVFVYVFLIVQFINLWDLLVIDWFIFTWITPEFVVLSGTEGAEGYNNYLFHFKAGYFSWGAWIGGIVLTTFVALVTIPMLSKRKN